MTSRPDIETIISKMDSPERVYDLFRELGYPTDKILDPSYKRKISEFGFAKDEREKVRNIFTVLNYDGKLQVFLLEVKSLSASLIRYLTKSFSDIYERFLIIFTADYKEYAFAFPRFERIENGKVRLKITRLVFDRENPYHTDLRTICGLGLTGEEGNYRDIWRHWQDAFSVEKVTDKFFEDYKRVFFRLRETFEKQKIPVKKAHELAQQFLNRLMFLYFIAKKRWLNDNPKFIRWYWERYKKERRDGRAQKDTFYEDWLRILFLEAFNNKYSHPSNHPRDVREILALAPYLNGGLFRRVDLDDLPFKVSDALFESVFNFLESYNFTIREELPLDVEVAVDPQMIGYVYESLSNVAEEIYERQDLGIFYTPTIEVDFMCRRAMVEYIAGRLPGLPRDKVYRLLFDDDRKDVENYMTEKGLWSGLEEALSGLAVVDPACGSGAFLVGMLHVLVDLYRLAYRHLERDMTDFELKKNIIGTSLYGVDVMPWAVHAAELRLWLQLIIDADIPRAERKLYPLLPNLTLKLRVGDSLVQEVGGVTLHMRDPNQPPTVKKKLNNLRREKEKFFNNDDTARFKSTRAFFMEEVRVFRGILDEKILDLKKKVQALEGKKREEQFELIEGIRKKGPDQGIIFEQEIEDCEREIERLRGIRSTLQDPEKKPFVWDIDFAEIFGDKGGFDIVIGNPPYVRQEKIAPPNKLKAEVTLQDKREYKEKLLRSIQAHFPFIKKLDKKSDYYIYFYFHGLALLNDKGTFCFITSNSWLDVGYGRDLQEFLLKYCPIKAIYDNESKRSFVHADVNTVIALFGAPDVRKAPGRWPALCETAHFVMFKRPFGEVLNAANLIDMEQAEKIKKTPSYRVYPIKQEALLEEGWEKAEKADTASDIRRKKTGSLLKGRFDSGRYMGDKWGGKYLRAPDIFFTILEKGRGKLVRLGDIAKVRRGFTTGCNEFFYLPSKHFDIKKDGKYYELIPKHEGLPKGIRIEEEYLPPAVLSPKDVDTLCFKSTYLKKHLLLVHSNQKVYGGLRKYLDWGVQQCFDKRPSCSSRDKWWSIAGRPPCKLACNYLVNDYMRFYYNPKGTWFSDNFQEVHSNANIFFLSIILNSVITQFFINMTGRSNFGGGLLKVQTYEVADLLCINPECVKIEDKFIKDILVKFANNCNDSIYEQCGFDPTRPIREQPPNPLPDRKALDDVVFDILGLTDDERREVYWAVCELVKNRLDKARSV